MPEVIRSFANALAQTVPGIVGGTSVQKLRDMHATLDARAGSLASIKEDTAIAGDGVFNDSAAVSTLFQTGGSYRVPKSTYLLSTLSSVTLTNPIKLYGVPGAIFTKGDPASTVTLFKPTNDFIAENIRLENGGGLLDFNGLATTINRVRIVNCEFENCEFATRWAELTPNANGKIGRFDFLFNTMINMSRAVFHSGAGASDALVLGNYLDGSDRTGINLSPEQSTPQSTGRSDRQIIAFNNVKHVAFSGANSNPIKSAGRLAIIHGNIVSDVIYNGVVGQENFEGIYTKTEGCIYSSNIVFNGSGGTQGMYAFKGGGRPAQGTGEPYGWLNLAVGNIGQHTAALAYTEDGFWVQAEEVLIGFNMFDRVQGEAMHVNKGSPFKDLGFYFNHYSDTNQGFNVEGAHTGVRLIGNLFTNTSAGHNFFIRLDTQSLGVMQNVQVQNNYAQVQTTKVSAWEFMDIRANGAADDINGLQITDNFFDATAGGANARGARFRGAGDIVGTPLFLGNYFRGFADATRVIFNETTGVNATCIIAFNVGFDSRTAGTGTIPVGQSSVTINHNLTQAVGFTVTPLPSDITITPTSKLAAGTSLAAPWVSATTATTFTVTIDGNQAAADFTFSWEVDKWKWTFS